MTRSTELCACSSLLALLVVQVAIVGTMNSPNCDEIGHLGSGLYLLDKARFDVYRVNPPLVRSIAAIPVAMSGPHRDYRAYAQGPATRVEWRIGQDFIAANPGNWEWYFPFARWALLPLIVLGGIVVYQWSSDLNGPQGGPISLALYCFCPNIVAWSATINPDAVAGVLGLVAGYSFWKWLRIPTWRRAVIAGLCLGLAELCKFSWIILFPLWPALWLVWQWRWRPTHQSTSNADVTPFDNQSFASSSIKQLAAVLLLAIYLVNLGYGFEGSFTPLRDYAFVSKTLTGEAANGGFAAGNRFRDTWLGLLPVPVPYNYLSGIDLQKVDFERGMDSYLNGRWWDHGHWYYYLYAALLKVPLGTWLLGLILIAERLATYLRRRTEQSGSTRDCGACATNDTAITCRDRIVLLAPAVVLFVLVSSQTGLNSYFRYVLPCFPFVYVWLGQLGCRLCQRKQGDPGSTTFSWWSRFRPWVIDAALAWSIINSLSVFPYSLSYFNELAGGPKGGHHFLIDANIDWGQDTYRLRQWLKQHPDVTRMHTLLRCAVPSLKSDREDNLMPDQPTPGWYAISIHHIHDRSKRYHYFMELKPIAVVGHSIYIYHITPSDANRARERAALLTTRAPRFF